MIRKVVLDCDAVTFRVSIVYRCSCVVLSGIANRSGGQRWQCKVCLLGDCVHWLAVWSWHLIEDLSLPLWWTASYLLLSKYHVSFNFNACTTVAYTSSPSLGWESMMTTSPRMTAVNAAHRCISILLMQLSFSDTFLLLLYLCHWAHFVIFEHFLILQHLLCKPWYRGTHANVAPCLFYAILHMLYSFSGKIISMIFLWQVT